jgi:chemotaxis protein CheX
MSLPNELDIAAIIREATNEVFSTMLGVDARISDPTVVQGTSAPKDGLMATVGLAGRLVGSGTITLSSEAACKDASAYLMDDYRPDNGEVLDAIGEMANMIVGGIKTRLEETGEPLGLSIPSVISGNNFVARSLSQNSGVAISFNCQGEEIEVTLYLARNAKNEASISSGYVQAHYIAG